MSYYYTIFIFILILKVNKIAFESEAMWLETKQITQDLISLIESRIQ